MPTESQFTGCLLGQCLGDALGFMVEGAQPRVCRRYVDEVLRPRHVPSITRGPFPFGQYSDDSQLARELLESYVALGRFEPADYAIRLAGLFTTGRIVGRGRATEQAALRIASGVPWEEAGAPPPSAGNGSAMRAGPIGLIYFDDLEALVSAARDQGRTTHQDPRCQAGSVLVAGAVALALTQRPLDRNRFLERLADLVAPFGTIFEAALLSMCDWLTLEPEEIAQTIAHTGTVNGRFDEWHGISPFVVSSVLWSVYAFLRSPGDYWESVCTAIAVGGDVDTTGAMAGAISGAYNGVEALPQEYVEFLNDQDSWTADDLITLAREAYLLKTRSIPHI